MGAKQSTNGRLRTYSNAGDSSGLTSNGPGGLHSPHGPGTSSSSSSAASRARARSLGSVHSPPPPDSYSIPNSNGDAATHPGGSPDSDASTPDDLHVPSLSSRFLQASSLPVHLLSLHGIKCPVCTKFVSPDDLECHLVMCLTKPRISYNEDVLPEDKGECVICFEELTKGDMIARLPCLCIYHKSCIDDWFKVNRSCPEHPSD